MNMDKIYQEAIAEDTEKKEEKSFLVGRPKKWSEITEEDNKKEWIWENYIAKGHITLLSALWKAGKSTLLRHLFLAICTEAEFGGQPTTKSKVLVLSEEAEGDWLEQKEELTPEEIDHVEIWPRPIRIKPNIKQWIQLIEEVTAYCLENKIDLVVIDTLSTFWPIDNENDSAQVMKALIPLYSLTQSNIAVLLVHHFRKGGGDEAQASRGSGALPGFVDNIIEFTRNKNGYLTQRILRTYGRFDGVIPTVVIDLTAKGEYITLGDPWEVSKSARLQKLIDIFRVNPQPLSAKEVFNSWALTSSEINLRSIQRYIRDLTTKNILFVVKEEVVVSKKVPFYALKEGFSQQLEMTTNLNTVPVLPPLSSASVTLLSPADQKHARDRDKEGTSVDSDASVLSPEEKEMLDILNK